MAEAAIEFEPLLDSEEAAKLLGNIHVKNPPTLCAPRKSARLSDRRALVFSRIGTGLVATISVKFVLPSVPHELGGIPNVQASTVSVWLAT